MISMLLAFVLLVASTNMPVEAMGSQSSFKNFAYEYSRLAIHRSIGQPIPWPKQVNYLTPSSKFLQIKRDKFFVAPSQSLATCVTVEKGLTRYLESYFFDDVMLPNQTKPTQDNKLGDLNKLSISDSGFGFKCEVVPDVNMDESYTLKVMMNDSPTATIAANSSWGVLRGLETFSQLIYGLDSNGNSFGLRPVIIHDEPRFNYRGFMLDTSRHYISPPKIKTVLDGMAHNKLNVFHWHFSDDQSYPLVSKAFPQLSELTAFRSHWTYNHSIVAEIISYANERGIRVMPELDSPGHTYALRSIENLLTTCYNPQSGEPTGDLGPIDPTNPKSYLIIASLIKEIKSTFLETYFHAGGDEVDYDCWRSNPKIQKWMEEHNIKNQYVQLINIYLKRIYDILSHHGKRMVVWQEVFDDRVSVPKDTIIQIWKYQNDKAAVMEELKRVVDAGYQAIVSSCWYMNYIDYGQDWVKFYQCDPADKQYIEPSKQKQVLGGEICMWSEFVDDTNVISRTWPRASAAAERLWSQANVTDVGNFLHRLEQIRCRMLFRGIQAEPVNGPGFC